MNIIQIIEGIRKRNNEFASDDPFVLLEDELSSGLSLYWMTAERILTGSGIKLMPPARGYASLENNFFSALFLYSYHRAGVPRKRRILYTAIIQCLRGMVTGCDNLLDDEYKPTLVTDLPDKGLRFRSVLDIMVSDRILFELLFKNYLVSDMNAEQILDAVAASISALTRSGAQEASEEGGVDSVLPPEQVVESVHHFKTGLLFKCPWSVPLIIEDCSKLSLGFLLEGLYKIGLGCQIMDDLADLSRDMRQSRHNFVASLIYYQSGADQWNRFKAKVLAEGYKAQPMKEFPEVISKAVQAARQYLVDGLMCLFDERHWNLVEPTIRFLSKRIGIEQIMYPI
jgi:hypothetical protein